MLQHAFSEGARGSVQALENKKRWRGDNDTGRPPRDAGMRTFKRLIVSSSLDKSLVGCFFFLSLGSLAFAGFCRKQHHITRSVVQKLSR